MNAKSKSTAKNQPDFNLKHRITGAGVLIFFGVLVLPWMLGPPSEAQKTPETDLSQDAPMIEPLHSTFEDQVLAELEGVDPDFVEPEESVYVSKITPVGGQTSEPQKVNETSDASQEVAAQTTAESSKSMATVLKKAIDKSRQEASSEDQQAAPDKSDANPAAATVAKATPRDSDSAALSEVNPSEAIPTEPKIEVGWVVQVELLTDNEGANRLVQRLNEKGFRPQTTTVDTNLGKSTGTRIWLGPFAERAGAGRENDRLEKQMGKRGFIRVYP